MFRITCPDCGSERLTQKRFWLCLDCELQFTDDDIPDPVGSGDDDGWCYGDVDDSVLNEITDEDEDSGEDSWT